jgi:hypothetical protein
MKTKPVKMKTQPSVGFNSLPHASPVLQPAVTCGNPFQPVEGKNVFLDRNGIKTCNDVTPVTCAQVRSTHLFPHNSTSFHVIIFSRPSVPLKLNKSTKISGLRFSPPCKVSGIFCKAAQGSASLSKINFFSLSEPPTEFDQFD